MLNKEECEHQANILKETIKATREKDSHKLKELSNKTIHSSCMYQDSASITIAVLIYTISKLIERGDYNRIKNWDLLIKKCANTLSLAVDALEKQKKEAYEKHIQKARKCIETATGSLKPYIQDVLKKAYINKGAKIYEHGISMGRTSNMLGISQWELSEYAGQKNIEVPHNNTISIKERAKMAWEFFS